MEGETYNPREAEETQMCATALKYRYNYKNTPKIGLLRCISLRRMTTQSKARAR